MSENKKNIKRRGPAESRSSTKPAPRSSFEKSSPRSHAAPKKDTSTKAKASGDKKDKAGKSERTKKQRAVPIWLFILLGTVLILVFAVWSYYPVAKQQYIASRDKERLEIELKMIEDRNKKLQEEIDRLNTPEGIEDYARTELGWVKEGESSVIVEGLDSAANPSTGVQSRIDPSEIVLPSTPWTRFCDYVFGIEE